MTLCNDYNPATSIFAGMSTPQLQTALANAQQAYLDLTTGNKLQTAAYTQGDGSKAVTYTKAELGALTLLIKQLQAQLGIVRHPRRSRGFVFR